MTTPLESKILRAINATGPLPIAEYMHLCHSHPEHGYYATKNPLGKKGDFVTAPEISQMFGELIAIWCISAWEAIGAPAPVQIVEPGPGRGTLMKDFIRTAGSNPHFRNAMRIRLIETSPRLKREQQKNLSECGFSIEWLKTIDSLESSTTFFIANEFLDTIPFRQFIRTNGKWLENCVGVNERNELIFAPGETGIDERSLPENHQLQPDGAIFETAPARESITASMASHIRIHGGGALIIDYGYEKPDFNNTFQAVQSHQTVCPLANPGCSDLTSHVDFQSLAIVANSMGLHTFGLMSQGEFLLKSGLLERAGRLGHGQSMEMQEQIRKDVERLASPEHMGELFKVFCMAVPGSHLPPFL